MSNVAMGYAQKAGLKLFQQHIQDYTPTDPLYENYTDAKGKQRRRKRELPPGLSKRDAAILKSVKRRAHYLDKGFTICGMRFGWTFIIGIIPGVGDVADTALSYLLIVRKAKKAEVPAWLLRRMMANTVASAMLGLIPLAGDVMLAAYKCNSRNAALLEEFLRIRGETFLEAQAGRIAPNTEVAKPGAGREPHERITPPKKSEAIPESQVPLTQREGALNEAGPSNAKASTSKSGPTIASAETRAAMTSEAGTSKGLGAPAKSAIAAGPPPRTSSEKKGSWFRGRKGRFVEDVSK